MKNRTHALLAALALSALAQTAHAGMIGDTVHVDYLFPDVASVYLDMGDKTVAAGGVSFPSYYGYFVLSVNDGQVAVDFTGNAMWNQTSFNGFALTDLSKALPAFTLDSASNMVGFSASNFHASGHTLYVNWQGLSFNSNTQVVLDAVPVKVPEPFALSLMGLGLLALGAARRR